MTELAVGLQRMVEGFRMVERREWDLLRESGHDSAWSIRISLSMIAAARQAGRKRWEDGVEEARRSWEILKRSSRQ